MVMSGEVVYTRFGGVGGSCPDDVVGSGGGVTPQVRRDRCTVKGATLADAETQH